MSDSTTVQHLLRHVDWTRELARSLVRDPHLADDIAQDAVLVAMRRPADSIADFRAWLRSVVGNLVRRRARTESRRHHREGSAARSEATASTAGLVERADTHRHLVSCVLELDDPHRTVLLQRYFEGMPPREIARAENCAVSTISNRLTQAHAALRKRLGRDGFEWRAAIVPLLAPRTSVASGLAASAAVWFSMQSVASVLAVAAVGFAVWWFASSPPAAPAPTSPPIALDPEHESGAADVADADSAARHAVAAPATNVATTAHGDLEIRIVDAHTGNPLQGLTVRLTHDDDEAWSKSVATDEQGVAAFARVRTGSTEVALDIADEEWVRRAEPVEIAADQRHLLDWPIALTSRIAGRLVDKDGVGVPNEEVILGKARAHKTELGNRIRDSRLVATVTSDAQGYFHAVGIEPGRYVVGPRGTRFRREKRADGRVYMMRRKRPHAAYMVELVVPRNTPEVQVEVPVWNDLFIEGRIRFPDGKPAEDILLLATLPGVAGYLRADSGKAGGFRFGPMPPGTYSLIDNHGPEGWGLFRSTRVKAGTKGVELVLQRAGILSGTIVDTIAGKPVPGWVLLQQADTGPHPRTGVALQTTCDPDGNGTFRVDSLEPANYHVTFYSDDREWFAYLPDVGVHSGREIAGIEALLQPAAQLEIEHNGPDGRLDFDIEHGGRLLIDWVLAQGESATFAVPPGQVTCVFKHRASGVTNDRRKVKTTTGEAARIVFAPE